MVHEYLINEKEVEIMAENLVNTFVTQVIENSDYEELDRIYLTNKVFTLVGEGVADVETDSSELIDLKDQLLQAGVKAGSVGELNEEQDIIGAQLMDLITPSPSAVNRNFWDTYKSNPEQPLHKILHIKHQLNTVTWKLRLTFQNLKKIPKPSLQLKMR